MAKNSYKALLPDLISIKSGRACLPSAGAIPHQPSQARPDFPMLGHVENPLPAALRLWATDRAIVPRTIT